MATKKSKLLASKRTASQKEIDNSIVYVPVVTQDYNPPFRNGMYTTMDEALTFGAKGVPDVIRVEIIKTTLAEAVRKNLKYF